jgi:Uma2 family endonuclease
MLNGMSAHSAIELPRWRFTVEDYERMGRAGILGEDDRVELLQGEIVAMARIGRVHAGVVDRLYHMLVRRLAGRASVRGQNPLRLAPHSEPQPDLVVVRSRHDYYQLAHPVPDDVLLVIEVAVHREPGDGTYARVTTAKPGEEVAATAFDDVALAVTDILGA